AALLTPDALVLAVSHPNDASAPGETVVLSFTDGATRTLWSTAPGVDVSSVAMSPDGGAIGAGTGEGNLVVVDVKTGRVRWRASGHEGPVSRAAWSPDGRWLA